MNISRTLLIGCLCLFLFGFGNKQSSKKDLKPDLNGTWQLVSYKYGLEKDFSEVMSFIQYRKMLSDGYFTWVSYGENGNDVIGAGGGTYSTSGSKYTETSDFFHPMGKEIVGTSTTFDFELDGKRWIISGTVRAVSLDPKTGKHDKVEEIRLEEIWERM